eukprot:2312009-Amphidinium_carterae.2
MSIWEVFGGRSSQASHSLCSLSAAGSKGGSTGTARLCTICIYRAACSRPARLSRPSTRVKVPVHLLHSCLPVTGKYACSILRRGIREWGCKQGARTMPGCLREGSPLLQAHRTEKPSSNKIVPLLLLTAGPAKRPVP